MYTFENLFLRVLKKKVPGFSPNFHFQKLILKSAFNHNTIKYQPLQREFTINPITKYEDDVKHYYYITGSETMPFNFCSGRVH